MKMNNKIGYIILAAGSIGCLIVSYLLIFMTFQSLCEYDYIGAMLYTSIIAIDVIAGREIIKLMRRISKESDNHDESI